MSASRDHGVLQRSSVPGAATLSRESTARPLDAATRSTMQSRFGHDFAQVRVHTGDAAARSADAVDARAYALGNDLVFGAGEYQPHSARGQRLLAHELAHVVQDGRSGSAAGAEERASSAAARVVQGHSVGASQLGASGGGLHREPKGKDAPASDDKDEPAPQFKPITLPWSVLSMQLPKLQAPSMLQPPQPAPFFQMPALNLGGGGGGASGGAPSFKLSQLPSFPMGSSASGPLAPYAPPQPKYFAPVPGTGGGSGPTPDLPSRVGLTDFGRFSLGLRFGLPVAPQPIPGTPPEHRPQPAFQVPGEGPSALSVSEYQFELLDMSMTGKVPTGFDAVDKGDLIKAGFGIVAKYIAPDLIASLAKKVSGKPGADFMLDFTVTGDFHGGGITFSMPLGKPKKPATSGSSSP